MSISYPTFPCSILHTLLDSFMYLLQELFLSERLSYGGEVLKGKGRLVLGLLAILNRTRYR
jgi:hypothetical protein